MIFSSTASLVQSIAKDCGIQIVQYERVHGGDINEAYCLYGHGIKYFLKLNDAVLYPDMFEKEAAGLNALRNSSAMVIPQVIKKGIAAGQQWLLLEWIEKGSVKKNSMENFGENLARMHQQAQLYFGWGEDNYTGSLLQFNTKHQTWSEFYTQCRVMPLVKRLFDEGRFSKTDIDLAASFCNRIADLFPQEPPALQHGDLWNGNYMINPDGNAVVFDPAVYCGHRETDIGMTKLFGGFSQPFYDAYHAVYPLEKNWQQRLPLSQLYPLLVHAVLFGGHYIQTAREIINRFR